MVMLKVLLKSFIFKYYYYFVIFVLKETEVNQFYFL